MINKMVLVWFACVIVGLALAAVGIRETTRYKYFQNRLPAPAIVLVLFLGIASALICSALLVLEFAKAAAHTGHG